MSDTLETVDGTVILGKGDAQLLGDFFMERGVVAYLEWFDDAPAVVQVRLVLLDGKVARGTEAGLAAGPSVAELVDDLAAHLPADVLFGEYARDSLPAGYEVALPEESLGEKDVRTLVYVTFPVHHIPLEAQALQRTMAVREAEGGAFVVTAGPDWWVPFMPVPKGAGPVVALQRASADDANLTVVADCAPEQWVIHDWAVRTRLVAGALREEQVALREQVAQAVGMRDDAMLVCSYVPRVSPTALQEALEKRGEAGFLAFLDALDVPTDLGRFVMGEGTLEELNDVVIHEPRGVSNAIGRSVQMWLEEDTDKPEWWETYEDVVEERPGLVRLLAAAEASVGAALLYRAATTSRGWPSKIACGAVGTLLLFDSVAELAFASFLRRRKARR